LYFDLASVGSRGGVCGEKRRRKEEEEEKGKKGFKCAPLYRQTLGPSLDLNACQADQQVEVLNLSKMTQSLGFSVICRTWQALSTSNLVPAGLLPSNYHRHHGRPLTPRCCQRALATCGSTDNAILHLVKMQLWWVAL